MITQAARRPWVSPPSIGHADADPVAFAGPGPGQGVTVSGCAGQAACSSPVMATVTPRAFRPWMWLRIFLSRMMRLAWKSRAEVTV